MGESVAYRSLAQGYLAWGNALHRFLDEAKSTSAMPRARASSSRWSWTRCRRPTRSPAILRRSRSSRHRRREPRAWAGEFRRRPRAQRRPAGSGRHPELRRRQELATTPGDGRVSHPGDGADPVPAEEPRCTAAAAHRPAANQQVLCVRSRAREEHHSVLPQGGVQTFAISWKNLLLPNAASGSTPMSRRWKKPWMRCATSPAAQRQHLGLVLRRNHHVGISRAPRGARRNQGPQRDRGGLGARHGGDAEHDGWNFVTPESIVAAKSASQLAGVVEGQELGACSPGCGPTT